MAAIRERGGRFHVQVRQSGFPARTATFPTRRLAERWAKTVESQCIEGTHFRGVEARRRTLGEAIDRYVADYLPRKRDPKSPAACLAWWKAKLGHVKLADITPALLTEYRDKLLREPFTRAKPGARGSTLKDGEAPREYQRSEATANRYLAYLSHVFTVARREWHWTSVDPFDGVGRFKEGAGRLRYLSEDERTRLLAETVKDSTLHLLVMLALSTTARAGELVGLTWRDVDLKEGRLMLRKTKNAQPRAAWVHGEALRLLKEHGRVRRLDDAHVFISVKGKRYRYKDGFEAACTAAGVKDFTFHGLRHSSATYLARQGATEQQLKAIGGWKSNVVARYVHLAAEDAKAIVEKMNAVVLGK